MCRPDDFPPYPTDDFYDELIDYVRTDTEVKFPEIQEDEHLEMDYEDRYTSDVD